MPSLRHRALSCHSESCREKAIAIHLGGTDFHLDWRPWTFKVMSCAYLTLWLVLAWWLLSPWSPAWSSDSTDLILEGSENLDKYFQSFSGNTECGISLTDIFSPPSKDSNGKFPRGSFCPNRKKLLEALSGGGRHGFDAPYTPQGCHHRWYSIEEICMILDRFDSLIFVGDDALRAVFGGLNILLRKDLSLGSLRTSEVIGEERQTCRCGNQFIKDSCSKYAVTSSDQISSTDQSPYMCSRVPLDFLPITGSLLSPSTLRSFSTLIPQAVSSNYHPIPIIFGHSPSQKSGAAVAAETLQSLLAVADSTHRKTPILWVGPSAIGHLDIHGGTGNNEIWRFSQEMDKVAKEKDVEVMGMWNMTVQASSWDGKKFGGRVAIVQAMMIINWLSRLESS